MSAVNLALESSPQSIGELGSVIENTTYAVICLQMLFLVFFCENLWYGEIYKGPYTRSAGLFFSF